MKDDEKRCWTCLHEENCKKWPPECVCEKWELDPILTEEGKKWTEKRTS